MFNMNFKTISDADLATFAQQLISNRFPDDIIKVINRVILARHIANIHDISNDFNDEDIGYQLKRNNRKWLQFLDDENTKFDRMMENHLRVIEAQRVVFEELENKKEVNRAEYETNLYLTVLNQLSTDYGTNPIEFSRTSLWGREAIIGTRIANRFKRRRTGPIPPYQNYAVTTVQIYKDTVVVKSHWLSLSVKDESDCLKFSTLFGGDMYYEVTVKGEMKKSFGDDGSPILNFIDTIQLPIDSITDGYLASFLTQIVDLREEIFDNTFTDDDKMNGIAMLAPERPFDIWIEGDAKGVNTYTKAVYEGTYVATSFYDAIRKRNSNPKNANESMIKKHTTAAYEAYTVDGKKVLETSFIAEPR